MALKLLEWLKEYQTPMLIRGAEPIDGATGNVLVLFPTNNRVHKEHRVRPRTNLRTAVYLCFSDSDVLIESETENVSMNGFFCRVSRLYAPGERFRFVLRLAPTHDRQSAHPVYLDGVAQVVHVKVGVGAQGFGLGCHLEAYRILPHEETLSFDSIREILTEPYSLRSTTESAAEASFSPSVALQ